MEKSPRETLEPMKEEKAQSFRRHQSQRGELALALMPTASVLGVLVLVEIFSRQRLLFASLASSAFLIYLDPSTAPTAFAPSLYRKSARRLSVLRLFQFSAKAIWRRPRRWS